MIGAGISSGVSSQAKPNIIPGLPPPAVLETPGAPSRKPLADIGGLAVDHIEDRHGLKIQAVGRIGITHVPDHVPDGLLYIHKGVGGNFAPHQNHGGGSEGFAGHPALGVLLKARVQNGVGNLIAEFIKGGLLPPIRR